MDFINEYYIKPVIDGTGYNLVNTLTYAALLIIAVILTYKLLKRLSISIDKKFFLGILPFIALGGTLRSIEDLRQSIGLEKNFFLITPLIYVTLFAIALSLLVFSILIEKKFRYSYHKIWFASGAVALALAFTQLQVVNSAGAALMILITGVWALLLVAAKFIASKKSQRVNTFLSIENMALLMIHLFDATTTFVAIEYYPYFEQHIVTGFFISSFGTFTIFALKLVVVSVVLYVFDKELAQDHEKRTFLKIVVAILGLGPGMRNFLRLLMGV